MEGAACCTVVWVVAGRAGEWRSPGCAARSEHAGHTCECECAWVRRAGFKGVGTLDRRGIVDAVYEAKALAADHTVEETTKAHYGM